MTLNFSNYVREKRVALREQGDRSFSLRQVAQRIGVEPSYLSKVERGETPPPSEQKIVRLARELGEDPDVLLALAGKVSIDLLEIIRKRPVLCGELIRELKHAPDHEVMRLILTLREGNLQKGLNR